MNTFGSGTIIDMTPDGAFAPKPSGGGLQVSGLTALAIASGVVLAIVALVIWVAVTLLPLLIALGVVLYLIARFRSWRRHGRPLAG